MTPAARLRALADVIADAELVDDAWTEELRELALDVEHLEGEVDYLVRGDEADR